MTFDPSLAAQAFLTLLVIMDPLGNVPVFLALTKRESRERRRRTALHAVTAATVLIYLFALFGTQILAYLSIGLPALQAGGGILLFLIALQMVSGEILTPDPDDTEGVNVAIVPLGTPLVAGPGAIATVMVFMAGEDGARVSLSNQVTVLVAIAAALAVVYLVLRYASVLERVLRESGIHLITRVFGMLLLAIAVQLVADAVRAFVAAS